MKQIYKITNTQNNRLYIGIVVKSGKTYLDRFAEHMSGLGGVWIWKDIQEGKSQPSDFVIEIIEQGNESVDYYRQMEIYYIEVFNSLYPQGYNGNKGNYIVQTPETIAKSVATRNAAIVAGTFIPRGLPGYANYRYPNGEVKKLSTKHPDVINNVVKHVNYNPNGKTQTSIRQKSEQRLKNNGLTDAEVAVLPHRKGFGQRMRKDLNFWNGRKKMSERHARKDFTLAELEQYAMRSVRVKEAWSRIDKESRLQRTLSGLTVMNALYVCEHCGIETNKGNYARWHGKNCKHQKYNV